MIKGKDPFNFKNNRVGYIDTSGKVVVKPVYTNCSNFNGDFALVNDTAGGIALINKNGKVIIPPAKHYIQLCQNGLFFVFYDKTMSLVNGKGKTIIPPGIYINHSVPPPTNIESTNDYGRGDFRRFTWAPSGFYASVFFKEYIGVKKGDKWAVINASGKEIAPAKFDGISIFNKGYATMVINKKQGVIDSAGNILVPAVYDKTAQTADNFVIVTNGDRSGVVSIHNKLLLPLLYHRITQASRSAFFVDTAFKTYYGHMGVADTAGRIIVPLTSSSIEKFGSGYLVYRDNQHVVITDRNGVKKFEEGRGSLTYPVWEVGYEEPAIVYNEKRDEFIRYEKVADLMYYRNDKWGVLDTTGEEATAAQFDRYEVTQNKNLITVRQNENEKWGIVSRQGKILVPCEYDQITSVGNGALSLRKGTKYAVADKDLNAISALKYDQLLLRQTYWENGSTLPENICAIIAGKWGFLNARGKEITWSIIIIW
jgi:hypothetical protein